MIAFSSLRSCLLISLIFMGIARVADALPMKPSLRQERMLETTHGTGGDRRTKPILGGDNSTWSPTTDGGGDSANDTENEPVEDGVSSNKATRNDDNGNPDDNDNTLDAGDGTTVDNDEVSAAPSTLTSPRPSPGETTSLAPTITATNDDAGNGNPPTETLAPTKTQTKQPTPAPKLPTAYPTKNPTRMPSPMPTTEAWGDKVKDETERIKVLASDRTAESFAVAITFLGIIGMLVTAHNLFENPDGLCANFCRLSLKIASLILKLVCFPCRLCCGKYSGYSTSDPKNRTLFVEEYTNDLELT
jgi:hypothetical protein